MTEFLEQLRTALAGFSSVSRLYSLTLEDGGPSDADELMVEAFFSDEQLQTIGERDIIALSTSAHVDLAALLGQRASLAVSLADGGRACFSGYISQAAMLGSEGGMARYCVRLTPWLWRLGQVRNSRAWQDKSVANIVDAVFSDYAPEARWRWSGEVYTFMAGAGPRSYCCQYRETDYDFITRLLTEEGLGWRYEETEDGGGMVLFAESTGDEAVPEDPSSAAGGGLRYHAARAGESQDTIQALHARRRMHVSLTSVLSYDYKAKQAVAASVPTLLKSGGKNMAALESYDSPGQYFYSNAAQAERYARLQMQAHEAGAQLCRGRSTVRTLRAGTRFALTQGPLDGGGDTPSYVVLRVLSVGVNNLPKPAQQGLAELFGPIPELLEDVASQHTGLPDDFALALAQAAQSGYANCIEALPAELPWRPVRAGGDGRNHPRPTAHGSQSAVVVGPDGGDQPGGADEIHCDALGRVRIRFHWQEDGRASCWVRVAQRSAGGGMGSQFLPRIGQEVLVQFLENDIDRPIIVGALYNGRGEGGVPATPGGLSPADSKDGLYAVAHDHRVSAQGNLSGGNSPVWHGASGESAGHRNGAAQWGLRSKEFGGTGYNQLLFDDTDGQGRIQLKSSHGASELNLGHLIHSADNHRGSLRGTGAELRTDAYGAVRAGAGLLISSYRIGHGAEARDPAGDNAPGIALMKQAAQIGATFSQAAQTHQTVGLASHLGAGKADESVLDDQSAPLKAMLTAVSGMVGKDSLDAARADAHARRTSPDDGKLPHSTDAIIAIAAKDGLGVTAGQAVQLANGETATLMSGGDSQFVTGGQFRMHSGQAIGVLGGAVQAGGQGLGLQLIAARDAIDLQAQADTLTVQARDEVSVISANGHIDWAAAKRISLSTEGGANITIEGGNITVQCPGKISIRAGKKDLDGPDRREYALPALPRSICKKCKRDAAKAGAPFSLVQS